MFETDRLPAGWLQRLLAMDEIWVPSVFSQRVFIAGGLPAGRILVVPEAVDTQFFAPEAGRPALVMPGKLLPRAGCGNSNAGDQLKGAATSCPFRFLAVGKWERRKNFEALLRAFLLEFHTAVAPVGTPASTTVTPGSATSAEGTSPHATHDPAASLNGVSEEGSSGAEVPQGSDAEASDDAVPSAAALAAPPSIVTSSAPKIQHVELVLLTAPYHTHREVRDELLELIRDTLRCKAGAGAGPEENSYAAVHCLRPADADRLSASPPVTLVHDVPQLQLPRLYGAVDAFVLPSRGEGWGRPHVEAMAMGLPVIATNWSGITEFLSERNGYPLRYTHLAPIPEGAFAGHLQAEADVAHLRQLMRHVVQHQSEAIAKGQQARADMVQLYSPSAVASFIEHHLARIGAQLASSTTALSESLAGHDSMRQLGEAALRSDGSIVHP
jgi:glycosyltransferase involved in cell wall biosynthesis